MRHLDAMLRILTETHYIVNGPSKPDLNKTQGRAGSWGDNPKKGQEVSLGESSLKDAQHIVLDGGHPHASLPLWDYQTLVFHRRQLSPGKG